MLNYPILTTKLNRPRCLQPYLKRERLEKLLAKNSDRVATIISAGAGYGKSTLVSQWIKNKPAIWVSCDTDMNTLEVFLSYLVHGFVKNEINSFLHTSQLLSSQNPVNEELLINTFFSEVNATTKKVYVVFDDFHLVKNPKIIQLLETYLSFPPENIHVLILSRHDPIFSFSKHRLSHSILEIRMRDLNLTATELELYANSSFDLALNKEQINLILRKTEGWFLGVNQLLYAYKELNIPLTKNNEVLNQLQFSDYFADEVIICQSEESQKVLFVCSLFSRFCKELITEILSDIDETITELDIIHTLTNRNNFTIGLDKSSRWFRFHHQFQDALQQYFTKHPFNDLRTECLQIGGEWFIKNSFYEDGIIKTIESGKAELAVRHLQKFRYKLLNTDQYTRLGHILSLFPAAIQESNTELLLIKSFILENQGKHEALAKLINKLIPVFADKPTNNQQLGEFKVMQTLLLFFSGKYKEALNTIDQALELIAPGAESIITFACAYKALTLNALNKYTEALRFLKVRLDSLNKTQYLSIVRILTSKIIIYSLNSDLRKMQQLIPQVIEKSAQHDFYETYGMGLYFQIELNYRTGKHSHCDKLFEESRELRYLMRPVWYAYLLGIQSYRYLHSNEKKLQESLNQLQTFSKEENAENIFQFQNALLTEVALKNENYKEALRLHKQTNYHLYPPIFYYYLPQVTELKVLLYTNMNKNLGEFYQTSEKLWDYAQNQSHQNLLLKLNIMTSVAAFIQNKEEDAFRYMKQALSISESTGDLFVYTEFSYHVHEILINTQVDEELIPHFQEVLALFEEKVKDITFKERDLKLLELIAKGHTNAQIAEQMFLSPESVKKYLYDIYKDLGVKNRMNAVLEARRAGIIQ